MDAGGHAVDFVKENRSLVGHFKEAGLAFFAGPRKGAADVAEEFAFEEVRRQGGAVDGHEGAVAAVAGVVDALGEEFFPRAAFALNQDGGVVFGHGGGSLYDFFHVSVDGLDIFEVVNGRHAGLGQFVADIFFQPLQLRDVSEGHDVVGSAVHEEEVRVGDEGIGGTADDRFMEGWFGTFDPVGEDIADIFRRHRYAEEVGSLFVDMGNGAACGIEDDAVRDVGQDGRHHGQLLIVLFFE